jgi:hypothetical protein
VQHSGAAAAEDYLPRGKLSIAPQPVEELRVPFPTDIVGIVDMRVPVTLFIDERGIVQRVRFDGPDLAPGFARAILDTFLFARFRPGELHSVPVRSQMRIEIDFRANPQVGARSIG